ncbi:MAG: AtpZ/AtpI family protein [Bacillota bacterium]|nr:AtpZ/AtpI family protein [Bacillota bacterium]
MRKIDFKSLQNLALITQVGFIMIIPIIGGVYLGSYLDTRFGTGSLFLFIFIIVGVVTAFMNLFKITIRKSKNKDGK